MITLNFQPTLRAALAVPALLLSSLLAACGGGGDGTLPQVTNIRAGNVGFGAITTITVEGSNLNTNISAVIEPGCFTTTRTSAPTNSTTQTFNCRIASIGDLRVRVRNADGAELGTLRLNVEAPRVQMTLTQGVLTGPFVIELDPERAPITAMNFMTYVNTSGCWYKDKLFHRVIKDFVAQGGGYIAGLAKAAGQGSPIKLESNNGLKNLKYSVAMARTDAPDSATSEFFINTQDNPSLDYVDAANPGYAVFGKVISGFNAIDEMNLVAVMTKTNEAGQTFQNAPIDNVVISDCRQTR